MNYIWTTRKRNPQFTHDVDVSGGLLWVGSDSNCHWKLINDVWLFQATHLWHTSLLTTCAILLLPSKYLVLSHTIVQWWFRSQVISLPSDRGQESPFWGVNTLHFPLTRFVWERTVINSEIGKTVCSNSGYLPVWGDSDTLIPFSLRCSLLSPCSNCCWTTG